MSFSYSDLVIKREINLMPFYYDHSSNIELVIREMFDNILAFIPFGVFVNSISYDRKLYKKILIVCLVPITIETIQYILAIGIFDVTDIINNSLGGMIGIITYCIFIRLIKNKEKLDKIIFIIGAVTSILLTIVLVLLLSLNS